MARPARCVEMAGVPEVGGWRHNLLTLIADGSYEEVPLLLDLPRELILSWHAEEDPLET